MSFQLFENFLTQHCKLLNFQKILPMRHKAFYTTISMPAMKLVMDFVIACGSEKMSKRVHIGKSFHQFEKLDKNILPQEYGGSIPMKVMIEMCKRELETKRELLISHDLMKTRQELYPKSLLIGSSKSLKMTIVEQVIKHEKQKESKSFKKTIQGSFRKLEID